MGSQDKVSWNLEDGTSAAGQLGRIEKSEDEVIFYVKADGESQVGNHRTVLRSCIANNLYELYFNIDVKNNNSPYFEEDIETTFRLSVGRPFEYRLPPVGDKEGNDYIEVLVKARDDKEYPKFLTFDRSTNTLIFRPENEMDKGKVFGFQVIVKE